MSFEIEKNVAIPPAKRAKNSGLTGVLRTMQVGDSVFAAGKSANQARSLMVNAQRDGGGKFTARAVEGGTRIWRTE